MGTPNASRNFLRQDRGLPSFALFTVAFMVLVILEGAVVRATGSGAGCGAHWPLCNGQILPHHPRLATIIEFTHRSLTGICTTLVAVLLAWTFAARPAGHRARKAAVATGLFLITEGALGAVLVLGGYVERNASNMRVLVQSVHFTNTMLLLAAMSLSWWWLRGEGPAAPAPLQGETKGLAVAALVATVLTGATGSVAALADTLFPAASLSAGLAQDFAANAPLLVRMRWMHPATTAVSVVCVLLLARRMRAGASGRWLGWLVGLQLVLGIADITLLAPLSLQVLHLLGADLLWIALVAASADVLQPAQASALPTPVASASLATH